MSIACYGNAVLDIIVQPAPQDPPFGASVHVEAIEQRLGGNGAATAYALGKLGIPVRLLAPVGRDLFGDYLVGKLVSVGVDVSGLERTAAPTAASVSLVNKAGERALLHRLGASAAGFAGPVDIPAGTTHIHAGTPFAVPHLRSKVPGLLATARARGIGTSIDTQWDSAGRWMADLAPSLPYTDYLFANHDEARMLTGAADPFEAGRRLMREGARTVVLKLGARGCAMFSAAGEWQCPAFPVPVLDTTGAGDCFVGGFLAALHRGRSLQEAAQFATAVAALSIQALGAVEGLVSWDETEAWMRHARRA